MSMKIINWDSLSLEERELNLKRPTIRNLDDQKNIVIDIFENIKRNGDAALQKYTLQYDNIEINNFLMTEDEINKAVNSCLLYTSPSPRDRTRSRMPSSA